jgi:transposase
MDAAKVVRKYYKFRIYPMKAQTAVLKQTLDLCRELYNAALQERRDAWTLNKVSVAIKDSKNFQKRKRIVARIYERIFNRRKNLAHQLSRNLVNKFDCIIFENLNLKGLMKNNHLSKAIGDCGLFCSGCIRLSFRALS